jgi:ATPase subunit of ABC transporter with duplicated ATPase domains
MEGLDALIGALKEFKGGVIVISHDERFITRVGTQVRKHLQAETNTTMLTYVSI